MPKPYYEHAGITIYHADCREVLPLLPNVDLVLTDPPYGIKADSWMSKDSGNQRGTMATAKGVYDLTNWDDKPPSLELLMQVIGKAKESILWGGNYFDLRPSRCFLVWDKCNGDNAFADCELAWTNIDKPVRLIRHMWNGMLRKNGEDRFGHPTQKPLGVITWCIAQATEPREVLDPFMGSGSTLVAAKRAGLPAIGIEIEERYCEIAAKRLSQEMLPFTELMGTAMRDADAAAEQYLIDLEDK